MKDRSGAESHAAKPFVLAALFLALIPWLVVEHLKGINPDIYWLTVGAGRLLSGATMTGAIYDPNPPLGVLLHIPLYLLWHGAGIDFPDAVLALTLLYILLASALVFLLGRLLLGAEAALVPAVSFFLACTVMCTSEFGQRDQLIVIALVPFVLGQLILTRSIACSRRFLCVIFAAGAILILLKPHYLLIPAVLIVHRLYLRRRLSVVFDPDAMILGIATLSYLLVIWLCFNDYARVIFPDVLGLYLGGKASDLVAARTVFYGAVMGTLLVVSRVVLRADESYRTITQVLIACAALSLIPYLIQMKGFTYHIVPAQAFLWTGSGMLVFAVVRRFLLMTMSIALLIAIFVTASCFVERPVSYPAAHEIRSFPLTRAVAECAGCRVEFFNTDIRAIMMTSYYAGTPYASRFPSLWFLQKLTEMKADAERERLFHKYARMVAEDLDKTDIVVACADGLDYPAYFSKNFDFSEKWKRFELTTTTFIDYNAFHPGIHVEMPLYPCSVYRRAKTSPRQMEAP